MLFKAKPSGFIPGEDLGRLYVTYEMAEASSTTQLGGMIAASTLAIFIVPVLFVVIIKMAYGKKHLESLAHRRDMLNLQLPETGQE